MQFFINTFVFAKHDIKQIITKLVSVNNNIAIFFFLYTCPDNINIITNHIIVYIKNKDVILEICDRELSGNDGYEYYKYNVLVHICYLTSRHFSYS